MEGTDVANQRQAEAIRSLKCFAHRSRRPNNADQLRLPRIRQPANYHIAPQLLTRFKTLGWNNDAEDMAHDTLIILLDKLRHSTLAEPKKVKAYSNQTASKVSIAARRKTRDEKQNPIALW